MKNADLKEKWAGRSVSAAFSESWREL